MFGLHSFCGATKWSSFMCIFCNWTLDAYKKNKNTVKLTFLSPFWCDKYCLSFIVYENLMEPKRHMCNAEWQFEHCATVHTLLCVAVRIRAKQIRQVCSFIHTVLHRQRRNTLTAPFYLYICICGTRSPETNGNLADITEYHRRSLSVAPKLFAEFRPKLTGLIECNWIGNQKTKL